MVATMRQSQPVRDRRVLPDRRASSQRVKQRLESALADLDKAFETYDSARSHRGALEKTVEREVMNLLKRARKAVDDAIMAWAGRMR